MIKRKKDPVLRIRKKDPTLMKRKRKDLNQDLRIDIQKKINRSKLFF
jgi:hypothetical protein